MAIRPSPTARRLSCHRSRRMAIRELAVLASGYIDHEAARLRYTDFSIAKPAGFRVGVFTAILEDVRIERQLGNAFPAAATTRQPWSIGWNPGSRSCRRQSAVAQQARRRAVALLRARLLGQTGLSAVADTLEARPMACSPTGRGLGYWPQPSRVRKDRLDHGRSSRWPAHRRHAGRKEAEFSARR